MRTVKPRILVLLVLTAAAAAACQGCGAKEPPGPAGPVSLHLTAPPSDPQLFYTEPGYLSGDDMIASGGFGVLFNAFTWATSPGSGQAAWTMRPLAGLKLGDAFAEPARAAVERSVRAAPRVRVTETVAEPLTDAAFYEKSLSRGVLSVQVTHGLSWNARMMVAAARVAYAPDPATEKPWPPTAWVYYCSEPIAAASDDEAVAKWAADGGARYRKAAAEAADGLARTLEAGYLAPPTAAGRPAGDGSPTEQLAVPGPFDRSPEAVVAAYEVIRRDGRRVTVRHRDSVYSSVLSETKP